jgi:hypothetical protein
VRRRRGDRHARFADRDAADAMVNRELRPWPSLHGLRRDPLERFDRERLERFVVEPLHALARVVIADQPDEAGDRAITVARNRGSDRGRIERRARHGKAGSGRHHFSIPARND